MLPPALYTTQPSTTRSAPSPSAAFGGWSAAGRRLVGQTALVASEFASGKDEEISARAHRIAAEAILETTVRLVNRASPDKAANTDCQFARKLWTLTAGELKHAEDHMLLLGRKNAMEDCDLPARDGHPAPRPPA